MVNWFKNRRKTKKANAPCPKSKPRVLDLTGKSRRKTRPHQLHQAFSILNWRPPGPPLRQEIEDLWEKWHEDVVYELLGPFLKEAAKSLTPKTERFLFHMAVMRWKADALPPEELDLLRSWIKDQQKLKGEVRVLPWSQEADEYGDPLFAENAYIQGYVIWTPQPEQPSRAHTKQLYRRSRYHGADGDGRDRRTDRLQSDGLPR